MLKGALSNVSCSPDFDYDFTTVLNFCLIRFATTAIILNFSGCLHFCPAFFLCKSTIPIIRKLILVRNNFNTVTVVYTLKLQALYVFSTIKFTRSIVLLLQLVSLSLHP